MLGPLSEPALPSPASLPPFPHSLPPGEEDKTLAIFLPEKKKKSRNKSVYVTCIRKANVYLVDLFKVKHVFLRGLKCLVFVGPGSGLGFSDCINAGPPRASLWSCRQRGVMDAKAMI